MMKEPLKLEIEGGHLYLEGLQLRGVINHKVKLSSDIPKGQAELELNLIVKFPDNMREQNPLQIGGEKE